MLAGVESTAQGFWFLAISTYFNLLYILLKINRAMAKELDTTHLTKPDIDPDDKARATKINDKNVKKQAWV